MFSLPAQPENTCEFTLFDVLCHGFHIILGFHSFSGHLHVTAGKFVHLPESFNVGSVHSPLAVLVCQRGGHRGDAVLYHKSSCGGISGSFVNCHCVGKKKEWSKFIPLLTSV